MSSHIDELEALESHDQLIRIPDQIDVPITSRIRRLIDAPAFQRLARIPQLGLVSLVYPGATHSRFEHSLGVYRNALLFIRRLLWIADWHPTEEQLESLILAALLHDIGHWPFCHPIEDTRLDGLPDHESVARRYICSREIANAIEQDWATTPDAVASLIEGSARDADDSILRSILSGPIDVDKLDYLYRDSVHCGVPYGHNFDVNRLINSLMLDEDDAGLAISAKGKTAAELMVFARYVMFSEVYWHHAVRSATVMFQRAFRDWYAPLPPHTRNRFIEWSQEELLNRLMADDAPDSTRELARALFGGHRQLYKRSLTMSCQNHSALYRQLAQRPFDSLVAVGDHVAGQIAQRLGTDVAEHKVLVDAPPVGLEVEFHVQVYDKTAKTYRPLREISPVVDALATRQFDDFVKQVRVFVHPKLVEPCRSFDFTDMLTQAIEATQASESGGPVG